eukprot:TRINITY_DN830_c0_g1_i1.p1 TRINITY_DN830_c0_g1~~TRINITY_DN830_c0_g1_i1.p1  ORF type:complete len:838 (+),score=158.53 TRINITY_DN830_c0_g1_i1:106-2619(+)
MENEAETSEYEEESFETSEVDSSFDEDEEDADTEEGFSEEADDPDHQNKLNSLLSNTLSKSDSRHRLVVPPLETELQTLKERGTEKKSARSSRARTSNRKTSSRRVSPKFVSTDTVGLAVPETEQPSQQLAPSPRKQLSSRNNSFPPLSTSPRPSTPNSLSVVNQDQNQNQSQPSSHLSSRGADPTKRSPRFMISEQPPSSRPVTVQISLPENPDPEKNQNNGSFLLQRRRSRTSEAAALRHTFHELGNQLSTQTSSPRPLQKQQRPQHIEPGTEPEPEPEPEPAPAPSFSLSLLPKADRGLDLDLSLVSPSGVESPPYPVLRKTHSHSELHNTLSNSLTEPSLKIKTQSYISINDKKRGGKKWGNRRGMWKLKKEEATSYSFDACLSQNINEEDLTRGLSNRDTLLLNDLFLVWGIPPMSGNCQDSFLSLLQQMTIEEEMRGVGGLSTPPSALSLRQTTALTPPPDSLIAPESGYQIDHLSPSLTPQITFRLDQNYYRQQFLGQRQWVFVGYENQRTPLMFSVLKTVESHSFKAFKASAKGYEVISIPIIRGSTSKGLSRCISEWITKNHNCHPIKIKDTRIHAQIAQLEESDPQKLKCVTFGVVYVLENQNEDNDIFSNVQTSPAYQEFLHCLGDTIKLEGWTEFSGGLDVKGNTKGTHSIFTEWRGIKIMFHVATLIPFSPNDAQQIERKNMIGNDIVVIVFKEGSQPYIPSTIRSHMNHVVVVVSPERDPTTGLVTRFRMACARRDTVPEFGPIIPAYLEKGPAFREIFLAKIVNGLRTSRSSGAFSRLFSLPRAEALGEVIEQYSASNKGKFVLFNKPSADSALTKSASRIF